MSDRIVISADVVLPLEVLTQTLGILAQKRKGKSYLARRFTEQLHQAGQQVVIVDPKGDWWGIRSAADGKRPGLPIVIIGGERGDAPLEPGGGEVVAKLVVEERVSVLLDLSLLRKHEIATFMTAFLEALYRLKAREVNRTPMMLVIDEADAIAPQKPQPNEARMLGACEDIVRRGGQRGIGCTMITQRSAVLSKNVLSQIQVLVTLCTIAPQDLAAINEWVDVHGTAAQRKTLMASLPSLPRGDAWWWSPGWPTEEGIFCRTHTLPIETFDSGATPKPGEKRVEPKHLADVDLEALRRQMADTIERAAAEDPKALRRRVAELEKQIAAKPAPKVEQKRVEVPVLKPADLVRLERAVEQLEKVTDRSGQAQQVVVAELGMLREALRLLRAPAQAAPAPRPVARPAPAPRAPAKEGGGGDVPRPQQRILDALAWYEVLGIAYPTRQALAIKCGLRVTGTYTNNLGALRTAGLIDYPQSGCVALTGEGRKQAGAPAMEPTDVSVQEAALEVVTGPQARILVELIAKYPGSLSREGLAERLGLQVTGTFTNNLGAMRTMGLIDYPRSGEVAATKLLFPSGVC